MHNQLEQCKFKCIPNSFQNGLNIKVQHPYCPSEVFLVATGNQLNEYTI